MWDDEKKNGTRSMTANTQREEDVGSLPGWRRRAQFGVREKKKEIRVRSENSGVYGVSPSLWGRWCELQNLKRSMKCWGETGVRQLSGSLDVQGCPES